jgi:hypothetical protein
MNGYLTGMIATFTMMLIIAIIFSCLIPNRYVYIIVCAIIVFLVSIFVIYDT